MLQQVKNELVFFLADIQQDKDLIIFIVSGTVILLILGIFIISFLFFYQRKHNTHVNEKEVLQTKFRQELIQSQLEVQEQTMQTIGADLHDNIGQLLSLTSLTLNSIELDNEVKARQKLETAIDLTVRSIKEMRQLGKLLQGDQLIVLGLSEAIKHQVIWMEKSGKYEISFLQDAELPAENNPDKDLILFRILQEILNNIIKHANATAINIKLTFNSEQIMLEIVDNGVGFNTVDMPAAQRGMGLQNIQKRAAIVGGKANIKSVSGEGTAITIFIPYP